MPGERCVRSTARLAEPVGRHDGSPPPECAPGWPIGAVRTPQEGSMTRTEVPRAGAAPPDRPNITPADGVVGGFTSRLRRRHGGLLRRRRMRRGALIGLVVVPVTGGIVVAFAVPMFGSGTRNAAYQAAAGPGHGRGMSQ